MITVNVGTEGEGCTLTLLQQKVNVIFFCPGPTFISSAIFHPQVNCLQVDGFSPLAVAVQQENAEVISVLLPNWRKTAADFALRLLAAQGQVSSLLGCLVGWLDVLVGIVVLRWGVLRDGSSLVVCIVLSV